MTRSRHDEPDPLAGITDPVDRMLTEIFSAPPPTKFELFWMHHIEWRLEYLRRWRFMRESRQGRSTWQWLTRKWQWLTSAPDGQEGPAPADSRYGDVLGFLAIVFFTVALASGLSVLLLDLGIGPFLRWLLSTFVLVAGLVAARGWYARRR